MASRTLAALATVAAVSAAAPVRQTEWQRWLVERTDLAAESASAAARHKLLARLASPALREELQACSSEAAALSPEKLADRLRREVAVTEVVSGFPAEVKLDPKFPQWTYVGMDLNEGFQGPPFFENIWQAGVRHSFNWSSTDWWGIADDVETKLYGMRAFERRASPSSMAEAAERAPYCMVNFHRIDAGSPLYGDVSAVLSPRLVQATSVVSAIDTGEWTGLCNSSRRWPGEKLPPAYNPNCSVYNSTPSIGTFDHFDHLFLVNEAYWKTSLGRILCRLLSPWGTFPLIGGDFLHYWEAMPQATLTYPGSIKFIIGSFPSLFGTASGEQLQQWCSSRGWVLVWSLGLNLKDAPNFFSVGALKGSFASDQRLADPLVLANTTAGANASVPEAVAAAFQYAWKVASLERAAAKRHGQLVPTGRLAAWWSQLLDKLPEKLRLRPLAADSCGDTERCVGTVPGGHCLCYQSPEALEAPLPEVPVSLGGNASILVV